jgi:hypothetical protein
MVTERVVPAPCIERIILYNNREINKQVAAIEVTTSLYMGESALQ